MSSEFLVTSLFSSYVLHTNSNSSCLTYDSLTPHPLRRVFQ
jgi:hypothetical protein